jgi:hypothetical protein
MSARNRRSWLGQPQAVIAFIHNRGFGADALFIRTKTTVGARSAQWRVTIFI